MAHLIKCPVCRGNVNPKNLHKHMKKVHRSNMDDSSSSTKENFYECSICHRLVSRRNLKRHSIDVHSSTSLHIFPDSPRNIISREDRQTDENFIDYYEYIASPAWKEKSTAAKKRAGNRCQICYRSSGNVELHTHHRTYARLGRELDTDLTVLCADCHKLYEENRKLKKYSH